jgi:tRNA nucleotidyltransferase (CCA-adding enzyme)
MTPDDLLQRLRKALAPNALSLLDAAVALAGREGIGLYLVGGAVRDLLLGRGHVDLDLALETEVAPLARALAAAGGGRAILHERFGTAVVHARGVRLDLAQTRRETYARPGALPAVTPATLADDLARRDFTINAMALRLSTPAGELVDPFAGAADLDAALVRVLHERSFQDDATRMLRAARYAARLSFRIEPRSEAWLRRDLAFLVAVSGPRLRRELSLTFEEPAAVAATALAANLGILTAIHPRLGFDPTTSAAWNGALAGPAYGPSDELGLCLVSRCKTESDVASLSARLHLAGRFERALLDLVRLHGLSDKLAAPDLTPPAAVESLESKAPAAVWALQIAGQGKAAKVCGRFLGEWRAVKPLLRGEDVIALGIPAGAGVGEALRALRAARLEGRVRTKAEEIDLLRSRYGLRAERTRGPTADAPSPPGRGLG